MIIIKDRSVCPYSENCPYNINHTCMGEDPNRGGDFVCKFVSPNGIFIKEGYQRSNLDLTGKMEFIQE